MGALVAAYLHRSRTPRLEYLPSLAPAVEAALVAGGFTVEGRLPLMVCAPGSTRDLPVPIGIELVAPTSDDDLLAMISAQNRARLARSQSGGIANGARLEWTQWGGTQRP